MVSFFRVPRCVKKSVREFSQPEETRAIFIEGVSRLLGVYPLRRLLWKLVGIVEIMDKSSLSIARRESLLVEEAEHNLLIKLKNMWKNREQIEEILFMLEVPNWPRALQQQSTAEDAELASVLERLREKFNSTLKTLEYFQARNSEFVFNTVIWRHAMAVSESYLVRRQLAELGSATGVYKTLMKYLVGVPELILPYRRYESDQVKYACGVTWNFQIFKFNVRVTSAHAYLEITSLSGTIHIRHFSRRSGLFAYVNNSSCSEVEVKCGASAIT
ncbi:hypothetical protein Sango_1434200 [Sesamum angolense]|uniref:Uncharacterized protein n=1 Tax=Sesamum angolense TaxID=2727404 RepID=A0AAE2BSB5_9LAMI|nr:hypothetical protein Sango_1434200 [Sesamum angolense]